jgi:hypothetical protein
MSIFNFPNKREREQGPTRLERTVENLRALISDIHTENSGGIGRFSAETKTLSDTVVELTVTGVTKSGNTVGLGRPELQALCDQLNSYLTADARPFIVSVIETPSSIPSTFDDDFIQNTTFTLQVTTQP